MEDLEYLNSSLVAFEINFEFLCLLEKQFIQISKLIIESAIIAKNTDRQRYLTTQVLKLWFAAYFSIKDEFTCVYSGGIMTDEQNSRVHHFIKPRTKDQYFIAMAREARPLTVSCSCLGMVKLIGEKKCPEQRYAHHRLQIIEERARKVLDVLIKVKRELMHILFQKFNATFMESIDEMYSQEELFRIKILYKKQIHYTIYLGS